MVTAEQWIVFGTLALALILFVSGRWRYDVVALAALLVVAVTGVVPGDQVFAGFGHPAVITVAAVLIISRAILNTGVVDSTVRLLSRAGNHPTLLVAALTTLVALCSGFMNNIGALALFLPVAIRMARNTGVSPSVLLMPMAFGSLLGGLLTLIGTPPNIIIAMFRAQTPAASPFRMFDFMPVGTAVTAAGVIFIALLGWRLIPRRKSPPSREDLFAIKDYITELNVPEKSIMAGKPLGELEKIAGSDVLIMGLIQGEQRLPDPGSHHVLHPCDVIIVKSDTRDLQALLDSTGLQLVGSRKIQKKDLRSCEEGLLEAVIMVNSPLEGKSAQSLKLRQRYGISLLAVARQGAGFHARISRIKLRAGDVLLLQGRSETLSSLLPELGCLPLAERGLQIDKPRRAALTLALFAAALAIAAVGLLPIEVAFSCAAVTMVLAGLISLKDAYESIDWPIIVLLGAMIPVSQALETTGGALLIADSLLALSGKMQPWLIMTIIFTTTMLLSNIVNNAAAALLMAPIAIDIALGIGASADPFLMAVAISASSAFLTPIGHQSNTLVLGPGGYKFGDYWRMGLPLGIVVTAVAIPMILLVWPL